MYKVSLLLTLSQYFYKWWQKASAPTTSIQSDFIKLAAETSLTPAVQNVQSEWKLVKSAAQLTSNQPREIS